MPTKSKTPTPRPSATRSIPDRFSPRMLARSVIAIPLLEEIKAERDAIGGYRQKHPELTKGRTVAIFYRPDFAGGTRAAWRETKELLKEAEKRTRDYFKQMQPDEPPIGPQTIAQPIKVKGKNLSLATLNGRIIRLLLAMSEDSDSRPIAGIWPKRHKVIIDINLGFKPRDGVLEKIQHRTRTAMEPDTRRMAKGLITRYIKVAKRQAGIDDPEQNIDPLKTGLVAQYVFARLEGSVILKLVALDDLRAESMAREEAAEAQKRDEAGAKEDVPTDQAKRVLIDETKLDVGRFRTIHHIWPDFRIRPCTVKSVATIKADAAHRSFSALGNGVTWAVVDTGIDGTHPHFTRHKNIDPASNYHQDFTGVPGAGPKTALTDPRGHGTHVAGIIAGEQVRRPKQTEEGPATPVADMRAVFQELGEHKQAEFKEITLDMIRGIAPETNLVSLKVLDEFGDGDAGNVIAALSHIQQINGHGRELHIHGVNISLGYPFEAKWFACGHTPLCVEINRLVKSGVVVVIAAGNTGYGTLQTGSGASETGLDLTINDPGNAEHAITVGSTHRDEPHKYGVSYFSSKGPTGDGRLKPDLLAPGEKIISCAVPGSNLSKMEGNLSQCRYMETSGTSMAAPHVSGAVAAFLSIRREFIGESERVKQIFLSTATDLGRDRYFQGAGLLDLMRAIQSV